MKQAAIQKAIQRHRKRDFGAFFQRMAAHREKWSNTHKKNRRQRNLEFQIILKTY